MKKIQITYVDFEEDYNALENSILSSELGVYAGVVGGYGNRGAQFEVFENINDQKYDRDYFSNSVSTLYRLPFLTLSRDKLANFKDECKFNVIRDRDKADIVVIGENTMSKMTETTYKNVFEYKDWKSVVLEKMIYANLEQNDKNYIINFINSIADDHGENVYISFNMGLIKYLRKKRFFRFI